MLSHPRQPVTAHVPPSAERKDRSDGKSPPTISDSRLGGLTEPGIHSCLKARVHLAAAWIPGTRVICCLFIMASERDDSLQSISVRLDGKIIRIGDEIDSFLVDTSTLVPDHHASSSLLIVTSTPYETVDPSSYVLLNVFAMSEELSALHKTDTWDLVTLPPGKSVIGSCWVYKIKTKSNGSIKRYKARLVVKSCLCSLIPLLGVSHNPGEACRLKKALYSLKQAPCAWFAKFFDVLTSLGFHPSHYDPAIFLKCTFTGCIFLLCIEVNFSPKGLTI
ncbi:hypothetical protein CK203_064646 [Vitis vinifera]|uniref:Reverse transcriptase Ty1/copia-type domain-containing protein n=1 Tax=Vitis vinifera TaxID=29760 RepID=A0A438G9N1_VITVI|nr:hypothetical protein CK203_064646 [Vitis vinifera]